MPHRHLFSRSLGAAPERIHLAAHSHHLWPDAAFDGHTEAALDAATLADHKWDKVFGEVIPDVQKRVARVLSLPDPSTLAFGPNTHDFLVRISTALQPAARPLRVTTTDGEFHSFARQATRFEEDGSWVVTRVPTEPFATFTERFVETLRSSDPDLVYVSQCFFDSGFVVDDVSLFAIARSLPREDACLVIDGYHAFGAVPTSLARIADRAFYLAGGYKYAMSGEGVCFVHAPPGILPRPRVTGWYAGFGTLEGGRDARVGFANDGSRMYGSTFDPSGLYRMRAVLAMLEREGLDTSAQLSYARNMEAAFFDALGPDADALVAPLVVSRGDARGRFVTFRTERAAALREALQKRHVVCDARRDRLRFGFAVYQDSATCAAGGAALRDVAAEVTRR